MFNIFGKKIGLNAEEAENKIKSLLAAYLREIGKCC